MICRAGSGAGECPTDSTGTGLDLRTGGDGNDNLAGLEFSIIDIPSRAFALGVATLQCSYCFGNVTLASSD